MYMQFVELFRMQNMRLRGDINIVRQRYNAKLEQECFDYIHVQKIYFRNKLIKLKSSLYTYSKK